MRAWFRGLCAALWIAVTWVPAAAAQDENDPRFREAMARYDEATALYERGDYESALAEFQRVYQLLEGLPRRFFVLFNMGRCQEQLFRYDEALSSYQQYLQQAGSQAERVGETRRAIRDLQNRLAQLTIRANTNAEVWVDDRRVGTTPGPVSVTGGRHVVELRAHGFAPARQDVQIAARTHQTLSFQLDRSFGGLHPAFVIAGGLLTLAAAGVGIGYGAVALSEQGTIEGRLASSDPRERFQVTQTQIDAVADNALIADIMFATAGVLGIATIVLVFVTDWSGGGSSGQARGPALVPWASPDGVGLSLGGWL